MSRLISHVSSTVWVLVRLPYEQPVLFPFNPPGPQSIHPRGTFIPLPAPPPTLRRGRNFKAGGNFTHPSGAERVGGFTLDLHADTHARVAFKSSEYFCSHLPLTFSPSCCCSQLCKPAVQAEKLIYFITGTHGDGALTPQNSVHSGSGQIPLLQPPPTRTTRTAGGGFTGAGALLRG